MTATYARTRKAAPAPLPFDVPAPFDAYLRTAVAKMEGLKAETKTAAAKVEKTFKTAAENVKEQAEVLASDPKMFVETMVRDGQNLRTSLRKNVIKVTGEVSKEANRIADEVTRRVTETMETVVETSLHRLNVPTRDELHDLDHKIELLAKKMEMLHKEPVVRKPRTPVVTE